MIRILFPLLLTACYAYTNPEKYKENAGRLMERKAVEINLTEKTCWYAANRGLLDPTWICVGNVSSGRVEVSCGYSCYIRPIE